MSISFRDAQKTDQLLLVIGCSLVFHSERVKFNGSQYTASW